MTTTQSSFQDAMQQVASDDAIALAQVVAQAIDDRADYETKKNPENDSIQKHVKSARSKLATATTARFFIAANVNVRYFNDAERVNARRNIYAILKLADLVHSVTLNAAHNAITRACLKSMIACADKDVAFTHKLALASASDKVTIDATVRKLLTRHTVSASTASTQASSSMSALVAAHVCEEYKTESNEQAYRLCDNDLVSHLRAAIA